MVTASRTRVFGFAAPCSGRVEWSSDFCSAHSEARCPDEEAGLGFTNTQVSETQYTKDGSRRSGTFEISIFDESGKLYSKSIYDTDSANTSCEP